MSLAETSFFKPDTPDSGRVHLTRISVSMPSKHDNMRLAIEYRQIASLQKYANNPHKHSGAQINAIAASIEEFGIVLPLLVDADNVIVAGEAVVTAAGRVGFTEIPVVTLAHLNADQVRALRLAHNRLAEGATWDDKLFRGEVGKLLDGADQALAAIVSAGDIESLLRGVKLVALPPAGGSKKNRNAAAAPAAAISRAGDIWLMGSHNLVCAEQPSDLAIDAMLAIDATIRAWQRAAGAAARLAVDGRAFAEIAKERGVAAAA